MKRESDISGIRGMMRRRKWWITAPFGCTMVLVLAVAVMLPDIYRSSAVILVENPRIPQNLVSSTVTSVAEQRIHSITQEVTSRAAILELIENYNLLSQKRERMATEDLVYAIRKRIIVEPLDSEIRRETLGKPVLLNIAFKLSFDDEDRERAREVAAEIASRYTGRNIEERERHARTTSRFLEDQLRQAKDRVDKLEEKLAAYREKHFDELPEFTSLNIQKLEKLHGDVNSLNVQIRSMEEQGAVIRSRLASMDPWFSEKVLSSGERLRQAQFERAALAARYTDRHPLVRAKSLEVALLGTKDTDPLDLARARERLQMARQEAADLKSRYTDQHPEIRMKLREIESITNEVALMESTAVLTRVPAGERATNPAYVTLRGDLDKLEISVASARQEVQRFEKLAAGLYETLRSTARVGREYNELSADHQNARALYTDLVHKYSAACISQGMEEEQLGETFRVVEAPFRPEKPIRPNRLAIVVVGMILGAGLAFGCASLVDFSDKSIRDVVGLEQAGGAPVLAVIPRIVTDRDRAGIRKNAVLACVGISMGLGVLILMVYIFL